MKKILLIFAVSVITVACTNNADNKGTSSDSAGNVVLPENRSSDSLAVPPQTSQDSTGVKKDSVK